MSAVCDSKLATSGRTSFPVRRLGHLDDDDGDGDQCEVFLDLLHFVASQVNEENAEEEIREAFRVFDGDGNGFIDRSSVRILIWILWIKRVKVSPRRELGLIMKFMGEALTEREIQLIIDEADVDHDGLIDYTEFFSMMNPK